MKTLGLLAIGFSLSFNVLAGSEDFLFHGQAFEKVDAWKTHTTVTDHQSGQTCTPQPDRCGYQTLSRQICNNAFPPECLIETYQEYACVPQAESCNNWASSTFSTDDIALIKAGVFFVNADFPMEVPFIYNVDEDVRVQPKSVPAGHIIGVGKKKLTKAELEELEVDEVFNVKFFKISEVRSDKIAGLKNVTIKKNSLSSKLTFNLKKAINRDEEIELFIESKFSRGLFEEPRYTKSTLKGSLDKWAAIVVKKADGSIDVEIPAIKLEISDHEKLKSITLMLRHTPVSHEGLAIFGDHELLASEASAQVKLVK